MLVNSLLILQEFKVLKTIGRLLVNMTLKHPLVLNLTQLYITKTNRSNGKLK